MPKIKIELNKADIEELLRKEYGEDSEITWDISPAADFMDRPTGGYNVFVDVQTPR